MWVKRLLDSPDLPCTYFFRHHLRAAFAGCTVQQILLLPAPSKSALDLLPAFYRSVMSSWFRLPRRDDNGKIIIGCCKHSFPIDNLTCNIAYKQLSKIKRVEHRCVQKYHSWGMDVDWNTVWGNLHLTGLSPTASFPQLTVFGAFACLSTPCAIAANRKTFSICSLGAI